MRAFTAWPYVGGLVAVACGARLAVFSMESGPEPDEMSQSEVFRNEPGGSAGREGSAGHRPVALPERGPVLARLEPKWRPHGEDPREDEAHRAPPDLAEDDSRTGPPASPVQVLFSGDNRSNAVALTFDDGPSRENTPRILSALRRLGVRATFFVEGRRVERFPDLARRIVGEGHEIAIHGWSHRSFRSLGPSELLREVADTRQAIREATGLDARLLRPPFGRFADSALALFSDLGVDVVLWSVDSEDWAGDPQEMIQNATAVEAGDIVLLHDRISTTADAVSAIVERVRARGLQLVTVSDLTNLVPYEDRPRRPTDASCLGGAIGP